MPRAMLRPSMADELAASRDGRLAAIADRYLPGSWSAAGVSVLSIALICVTELAEPRLTSLGSLVLVVVLAAAWLLDGRLLLLVMALALFSRAVASLAGGLDVGTAVAESVAIVLIAGSTRAAATAKARSVAAERRAAEHQAALARFDERERIGSEVQSTAVRRLFGVTLSIEAALESSTAESTRRLHSAVSELDEVCSDIRSTIFRGSSD
jgi:signal transduction histidine kinase